MLLCIECANLRVYLPKIKSKSDAPLSFGHPPIFKIGKWGDRDDLPKQVTFHFHEQESPPIFALQNGGTEGGQG